MLDRTTVKRIPIILAPLLLFAVTVLAYGPGKILVQAAPSATTTTIYAVPTTVPGGPDSNAVITTVWVTNTDNSAHVWRLAIAAACATDTIAQYIYYGISLPANSSLIQSVDLPLSSGDCVRAMSDGDQKLNFELFGQTTP